MTLDACEFMRRFLLHTLPRGFVRIRHYGFLANRDRTRNLDHCRKLLGLEQSEGSLGSSCGKAEADEAPEVSCPACQTGRMIIIEMLPRQDAKVPRPHFSLANSPQVLDSS
jgi:hypothetical protein